MAEVKPVDPTPEYYNVKSRLLEKVLDIVEDETKADSMQGSETPSPSKKHYTKLSEASPLVKAPPLPPGQVLLNNFLGSSPLWYKFVIISFLGFNPLFLITIGKFWTGWILTLEFIFTLIMALHCYPLQPGGLLILEAVTMGMVSTAGVYKNVHENLPVILLVIFMVAGIHFMREFLMYFFTKLLLAVPDKTTLSLVFLLSTAVFSAWLDALTVTAVLINVCYGFYSIYHRVAVEESRALRLGNIIPGTPTTSPERHGHDHGHGHGHGQAEREEELAPEQTQTLDDFTLFLRSLLMHAVVGTAVGGTFTMVGEPQNLLIGEKVGWNFLEYFLRCSPVTIPTAFVALITLIALEQFGTLGKTFGYGYKMPTKVRTVLEEHSESMSRQQTHSVKAIIAVQVFVAGLLIVCLGTHVAAVGLIGLSVIIVLTSFNGVTEEHKLGESFQEAMPFAALLVLFFAVAGIIEENELFRGMVEAILHMKGTHQMGWLYCLDGALSSLSDNVFVATLYITEVVYSYNLGQITKSQLNLLAVTINISTNIPSIATPNGQAAFLFLYTSRLAPLVKLSYFRMLFMALPYTITLSLISFFVCLHLESATEFLVSIGLLDSI